MKKEKEIKLLVRSSGLLNLARKIAKVDKDDFDMSIKWFSKKDKKLYHKNKKIIYFFGENLYRRYKVISFLTLFHYKLNMNFLNNVYFFKSFNKILNIDLFKVYGKQIKFIKKNPNHFVLSNKCENILSVPLFILNDLNPKNTITTKKKKFCAFIFSSFSDIERINFFIKLSKYKKVDSYGRILNNTNLKSKRYQYDFNLSVYKEYKFVICFENSYAEDYITEKLPNAMLGNSIPIYRGASNVSDYFNTKSFINYDDYGSYDKMIEKIIELDCDDEKYYEFLKLPWMTKQNKKNVENKLEKLKKFLKESVRDKKNGK